MRTSGHLLLLLGLVFTPLNLPAQENNFGITAFYGDAVNVGLRVKVAPSFVFRPTVGLTNTKAKVALIGSHLTYRIGLDFLYSEDVAISTTRFQPYGGGGFSFWYDEQRFEGFPPARTILRRLSLLGILGASYWMDERFGFFGEVGLSIGDDPRLDGSYYQLTTISRLGLNLMF